MRKKISAVAVGSVLMCPVLGQAVTEGPGVRPMMEEVVVTATRQEEGISSIPANVTVIDEEEIANSTARNVPDLLRTEVGVHVVDITGNGRSYSVDLRGFGETAGLNTLVLVDGRRINQPDLSGVDWTLISLDRVKRIEIVRGGRGSVMYGDNAAGGVVNIITKDGGPTAISGEIAAGSYDTFKSQAAVSGSVENFSYAFSGRYFDTDGYRDNSESEAKDAGLNLRYFLGERAALDLSGDYHKDDTGLPGALTEADLAVLPRTATRSPDDFAETEDYYVKAGTELFFLTDSSLRFDASYRQRDKLAFFSLWGGSFTGDTTIDTVSFNPHLALRESLAGRPNKLLIGFDYQKAEEDILNRSTFSGVGQFELEKENYGAYIHDELTPLEGLTVSGGYRYDRVEYTFDPSTPPEADYSENLYTAGLNYNYLDNSYAYLSYARSFRYPVLDELFSFFFNTVDAALRPQTSDDYEAGLRHYLADNFYLHLNYFLVETEDEIFYNPLLYANVNLDGKSRRQGVEVSFVKSFAWASFTGSYTYTDATIRSGDFSGSDVPGVPKHQASLSTVIPLGLGFSMALQGLYIGERRFISDFQNNFGKQGDYLVLNAKLKYNWQNLTAYLDLNNLLDQEYSEFGAIRGNSTRAFYPSPKMNFLAGVSVSY